jgi:hypothetical protein
MQWQEEEVAWGDFVDYLDVEASADLSIQRLQESNKWPGTARTPYQFSNNPGAAANNLLLENDGCRHMKEWDYVPDGLLVWHAWQEWLQQQR